MSRGRRAAVVLAILMPVAAIGGWVAARSTNDDSSARGPSFDVADVDDDVTEFDHDYLIPAGTAARIASGEEIEILPQELVMTVGESIRIVNDDSEGHVVGVFYVAAGETLTQRFNTPGVLSGECSVHPSGEFTLRVVDA